MEDVLNSPYDSEQYAKLQLEEWKPTKAEMAIMVSLAFLSIVTALDTTVLVPALPTLAEVLHGGTVDSFWAGTSYLLTTTIFQPIFASLSENFGRRAMLLSALTLFTAGTAIACSANNFHQLLAGRSIQGAGGGGIFAIVLIIFADIVPLKQRPLYWGLIQAAWALGTICGPVVGGAFSSEKLWRWIFYINFPFCGVSFVTVPWFVKYQDPIGDMRDRLEELDFVGLVMFTASTTTFLIGLTWGGVQYGWETWHVLTPLILGAVGMAVTAIWEIRFPKHPIINVSLLLNGSVTQNAAFLGGLVQGLILFAQGYYIPLFLESVKRFSPLEAGVSGLPVTCGLLPTSILIGIVIGRTGNFRWPLWVGWPLLILTSGLLNLMDAHTPKSVWVSLFIVLGLSHGLLLGPCLFAAQASASAIEVVQATAMFTFSRSLGMCLGVAVGGTVFQNILLQGLRINNLPEGISRNAVAYLKELSDPNVPESLKIEVIELYAKAFQGLMSVLAGFALVGWISSWFLKNKNLDKGLAFPLSSAIGK